MPESVDREITLRDYGRVLWRGRWLILGATIAAAIVGILLSVASPTTYTATSQVFLGQATTASGAIAQAATTSPVTAPEILTSNAIVRQVADDLGLAPGRVRSAVTFEIPDGAGTQNQPSLATITAVDGTRQVAIDIAEAYAQAVLVQVSTSFEQVQGTYRSSLDRNRDNIERLEEDIALFVRELAEAEGTPAFVTWQILLSNAQAQLSTAQTATTQAELQLATGQQFAPAIGDLPTGATSTGSIRSRAQTVLFAAIIGLLVGVTVTFVWRGSPAGRGRREA